MRGSAKKMAATAAVRTDTSTKLARFEIIRPLFKPTILSASVGEAMYPNGIALRERLN